MSTSRRRKPGPPGSRAAPARWVVAPALGLALSLAGCGGAAGPPVTPPDPPTTCPLPVAAASPTFRGHVLPALRSSCGAGSTASCHGLTPEVGHVSFAPELTPAQVHAQLVGVAPSSAPGAAEWLRVAAGDPAHSWLLEKVTRDDPGGVGRAYGNRMPYGLPDLCAPTVQVFTTWISLGALDD